MSAGVLLDPRTGKVEQPSELLGPSGLPLSIERNLEEGWTPWRSQQALGGLIDLDLEGRVPDSVLENLMKARESRQQAGDTSMRFNPMNAGNFYTQPLSWILADGTQVLNTTTETIMVPSFTIPAGTWIPGTTMRYTVFFDTSTVVTTPGTITLRLRAGGAGGTSLVASGAYAPDPTGASTSVSGYVEYLLTCRSIGTSGTVMVMGRMWLSDVDDASATTIIGNLNMHVIPAASPATATINTTIANTIDPTVQFSVATATTQLTAHLALLESIV